eukprot:4638970-Prymnesium_polylepis.1
MAFRGARKSVQGVPRRARHGWSSEGVLWSALMARAVEPSAGVYDGLLSPRPQQIRLACAPEGSPGAPLGRAL